MAGERKFIRENTNRVLIKEFLIKKVEGAGFGGMNIQRTPMGTRIFLVGNVRSPSPLFFESDFSSFLLKS
jgi:ribosomal protein S3